MSLLTPALYSNRMWSLLVQVAEQLTSALSSSKFCESPLLNLADSFSRQLHICSDFGKGLRVLPVKAKTPLDDYPFFFVELFQQPMELFVKGLPDESRINRNNTFVFN